MDIVERLTLETAQADTMLACEHRQRYEFAAGLCAGRRVLDLCCGSGYGSAILATTAQAVTGVDNDAATVEMARITVGRDTPSLEIELADAVAFLASDIAARFDVVVCFEGLEHLPELNRALTLLQTHAEHGVRIVASVPNGKLFEEDNPYHVTEFGYDEATRAFAPFPSAVMVPQFLAEGSLICPPGATETDVAVTLEDRDEPEYANHFIFCVGFDPAEVQRAHHGRIQLNTSPCSTAGPRTSSVAPGRSGVRTPAWRGLGSARPARPPRRRSPPSASGRGRSPGLPSVARLPRRGWPSSRSSSGGLVRRSRRPRGPTLRRSGPSPRW